MARKDIFGVEVEVGDIVFSAPQGGGYNSGEVGQVSGVFESGRVTIKYPTSRAIYAYEEGAPDVEVDTNGYLYNEDGTPKMVERKRYDGSVYTTQDWGPMKVMRPDYTVVRREPYWARKQAADITLVVLKKRGQEAKTLEDLFKLNGLAKGIDLDYDAPAPPLGDAS